MDNYDQSRPDVLHNRTWSDDIIKGRWKEVKGGVRKLWGELTDDELEETKGKMTSIAGLIQRKYGETKESVDQKLDGVFREFHERNPDVETDDFEDEINEDFPSENSVDAGSRNARERQL